MPMTKRTQIVVENAIAQLLGPLASFMLDAGLGTRQVQRLLRTALVQAALSKQRGASSRVNISRISIATGIPRGQVTRIIRTSRSKGNDLVAGGHVANRVLAGWHEDPKFTTKSGRPSVLRIFGPGVTFEALARKYGASAPVRALLDELVQAGSVELLKAQRVSARSSINLHRGLGPTAINNFRDRATELLNTLLHNMKNPESPRLVATTQVRDVAHYLLPISRRDLAKRTSEFLLQIQNDLSPSDAKDSLVDNRPERESHTNISVTVYAFEEAASGIAIEQIPRKRKNFSRGL
jgi:Family of unknown function (DUF6502)